jgi:heptosyltransferase-2
MRTLVVQTSFLGDMVLTTPLLTALSQVDEVDVLGTPAAAALLANHPAIRRVVAYDKRKSDSGVRGFLRVARSLREYDYDRALFAQGSMRSASLGLVARIPQRIGFDTSAGKRLYTRRIPYIENEHHARRLLSLGGFGDDVPLRPSLYPGDEERAAVDRLLGDAGADELIALAPGSVWPTKRWPDYDVLARKLAKRGRVVIIGSQEDRELAISMRDAAPGAVDATGKLSLLASAELIRRCRVLVTNDSAPQHLASAMNTPTVTIFGPTVPEFGFGPLAERRRTIGIDSLACRPCDKHGPVVCPLKHWKCMTDLRAETVAAAVGLVRG